MALIDSYNLSIDPVFRNRVKALVVVGANYVKNQTWDGVNGQYPVRFWKRADLADEAYRNVDEVASWFYMPLAIDAEIIAAYIGGGNNQAAVTDQLLYQNIEEHWDKIARVNTHDTTVVPGA